METVIIGPAAATTTPSTASYANAYATTFANEPHARYANVHANAYGTCRHAAIGATTNANGHAEKYGRTDGDGWCWHDSSDAGK